MDEIIKKIQTNYQQSKQKCTIPVIDGDYTSHTLYQHGSLVYNSMTSKLMIYTTGGDENEDDDDGVGCKNEDGIWRVIS